ncbi:MAG: hypothetical protein NXI16_13575 [Alphaproteobacteria bacterium]|nr:hypothetical protein [Alphaproteobacteria bacterium]
MRLALILAAAGLVAATAPAQAGDLGFRIGAQLGASGHHRDHYRDHKHWKKRHWRKKAWRRHLRHHRRFHSYGGWDHGHGGWDWYGGPRTRVIVVPRERVVVRPARPSEIVAAPVDARPYSRDHCREYQREVTIGREAAIAYGTACLQQDGQWRIVSENPPVIGGRLDFEGR